MKLLFALFVVCTGVIACSDNKSTTSTEANATPAAKKDSNDKVELAIIPIGSEAYPDSTIKSVKSQAKGNINGRHFTVDYYSPAVRGRIIWGGLVPFDKPWVTGAHNATSIETEAPIIINGKSIPAGKYALFTIPSQKEWIFIINKNWKQHLTDSYNDTDDLVRFSVKADSLDYTQERLRWSVEQTGEYKGKFDIRWERVKIIVPFEVGR